jgi:hypothetical protein
MRRALYGILILVATIHHTTYSFVRQLLKSPPIIDRKEIWRRHEFNLAIYGNFSLTLMRSLEMPTPSYVQVIHRLCTF